MSFRDSQRAGSSSSRRSRSIIFGLLARPGGGANVLPDRIARTFGPCLLPKKFCKFFHILRHIKSLNVCMRY